MNKELQVHNYIEKKYLLSFCGIFDKYAFNFINNKLVACLFCLIISSTATLLAQPIINRNILPKADDTIYMANDNLPEGITVFPYKGKQDWDFTSLQSAFSKKTAIKKLVKRKMKKRFPKADIVIENLAGVKEYYYLHKNELKLVGTEGVDPYGLGLQVQTRYEPAYATLKLPLEYGDVSNTSGRFYCQLSARQLPISILYSLPILPDSIRFVSTVETSREADAWGHLILPDNSFEVLRERRITVTRTKLEVKVGFFPWRDITNELYSYAFPKEKIELSYHFYSNETIMPVAEVYMKTDGINAQDIHYQVTDPSSTIRSNSGDPDVYVYPNPVIDNARFEVSNLPPDRYTLKIFNILGMTIREESYQLSGYKAIKWDVSKLRKGTYLYSLTNAKGKTIATRRLMVIRP